MIKIAKLSLVVFTLLFTQLTHLHAESIEVTLHDQQIKLFLAQKGLNFDFECETETLDSYNVKANLVNLVKNIFKANSFSTPYVNFPKSEEEFEDILYNLLKIPSLDEHDSNDTNQQFFNSLLQDRDFYSQTIKDSINYLLNVSDLYENIGIAISSHLCQQDKTTVHLYIKIILDTDTKIVTVQAAPNHNQNGFTRTYEKEIIENRVAQVDGKKAHAHAKKLNNSQKPGRSCFGTKTLLLGAGLLGVATYAAYNLDMMNTESLAHFYHEAFNN